MDAEKVESLLQKLAEIVFSIDKEVAELRVSVAVLKATSASLLRPDDPKDGLQHIESLEAHARKADPTASQRQRLSDVIDAIKTMKKHGGGPYES